jgi:hypothetical protein
VRPYRQRLGGERGNTTATPGLIVVTFGSFIEL